MAEADCQSAVQQIDNLRYITSVSLWSMLFIAIISYGLDRAAIKRLCAEVFLLLRDGLALDEGQTFTVITDKNIWGDFAAAITVDAIIVHVEGAGGAPGNFVLGIGHGLVGVGV